MAVHLSGGHIHACRLCLGRESIERGLGGRRVLDADEPDDREVEPGTAALDERAEVGQAGHGDGDLTAEPGLDVVRIGHVTLGRRGHQPLEGVVGLELQRRGILETRETSEQLADLLALVAGQVEPNVRVEHGGRRQIAWRDGRQAAPTSEEGHEADADGDDGDDADGDHPATAALTAFGRQRRPVGSRVERRARCRDGGWGDGVLGGRQVGDRRDRRCVGGSRV